MAIPTRIDMTIEQGNNVGGNYSGGNCGYIVETPTGALYIFYIDFNNDIVFKKSTDYGLTWSAVTALKAATISQFAVWYDRWTDPTGTLGDLIHVVYTDVVTDDTFYRTIDTASADSLGTERTPFAGASTAGGGAISVSRMRGGNVIIAGSIDAGTEVFAYKTADLGVNWTAIANPYEASPDKLILVPGWGADTNDAMCFYYDNSGNEVSVKYYDDSLDSWSEASIATSITLPDHSTTSLGHWSATVDHTNSKNLIAFWTSVDTANSDLRVFSCSQSAQTETAANCVLNSTDDQGFAVISINSNNENWIITYAGKSDGSEVYLTYNNLYQKISTDGGANWGSETLISIRHSWALRVMYGNPRFYKTNPVYYSDNLSHIVNIPLAIPHTTFQLGM